MKGINLSGLAFIDTLTPGTVVDYLGQRYIHCGFHFLEVTDVSIFPIASLLDEKWEWQTMRPLLELSADNSTVYPPPQRRE